MGIGDILSKSISYPFSDITKFLIIGIGVIIVDLDTVFGELFGTESFMVILGFIIAVLFSIVMLCNSINVI